MDDDKFYVPNRLEIKPGAFYFVAKCPNTKKKLLDVGIRGLRPVARASPH